MDTKKIAIACQGGGTHAAFTWGVLTKILETIQAWDIEGGDDQRLEVTAISGTSAGALCALATWYGLAPNTADPECGSYDKAIERLDYLWTTFAAETPVEKTHDLVVRAMLDLKEHGAPFPESSPYRIYGDLALAGLSLLGARQQYLGFAALLDSLCPHFTDIDWPQLAKKNRRILAGAIEVISGNFEAFDSDKTLEEKGLRPTCKKHEESQHARWRMRRALSLEGIAASGTLPEVLKAQRIKDTEFPKCGGGTVKRDAYYWDGLYSQNPPVQLFLDASSKEEKPNEIWVIRINPQEMDPRKEPTSLEEIRDRQNELAGNVSLNAELDYILTMNKWIKKFGDKHPLLSERQTVDVRTIKMPRDTAWRLQRSSKFHRGSEHLENLRVQGREVAERWLEGWRTQGDDFDSYPDDARYAEGE